jgi:hypothetical protein
MERTSSKAWDDFHSGQKWAGIGAYPMIIIGIFTISIKKEIFFERLLNLIANIGETGSQIAGERVTYHRDVIPTVAHILTQCVPDLNELKGRHIVRDMRRAGRRGRFTSLVGSQTLSSLSLAVRSSSINWPEQYTTQPCRHGTLKTPFWYCRAM